MDGLRLLAYDVFGKFSPMARGFHTPYFSTHKLFFNKCKPNVKQNFERTFKVLMFLSLHISNPQTFISLVINPSCLWLSIYHVLVPWVLINGLFFFLGNFGIVKVF
jgi:hypothetical protein